MTSRTKDLGESYLQSEELSDEGEDTDTLLAEELRGMYRNRLKDMEEVDEKRDEAHRVGYHRLFGCAGDYAKSKQNGNKFAEHGVTPAEKNFSIQIYIRRQFPKMLWLLFCLIPFFRFLGKSDSSCSCRFYILWLCFDR